MSLNPFGKVYIVGAGCGDYDLITLRGKRLLESCDTVVYDSLIDSRLLNFVPKKAEKICVGKRAGKHSEKQENINTLLVEKAMEGKKVVRLKGGDPFVFGRGGEEVISLKENNIEFDIVPGISSSVAVPELAGIPVTHRRISRSFHVITAHTEDDILPENIGSYSELEGTLVFLMGLKKIRQLAETLIKNGKNPDTPTAVISKGACKNQKTVRGCLKDIADISEKNKITAPAVIVVGDCAEFDFSPTINLPLKNISVAVTGTERFVNKLSERLSLLGAIVSDLDYLKVVEYRDNPKADIALQNISDYSWIVLTSINGAEIFFKRLSRLKIDIRNLHDIKFAVIGSGTAEVLEKHGIFADLVPNIYTSKELAENLSKNLRAGERVLVLRAEKGSAELSEIFDRNQVIYDDIKTYDVLSDTDIIDNNEVNADFIVFASSSGVKAFFDNGGKIAENTKVICIGSVTANMLKSYHFSHFSICKKSNADGIIECILSEVH